MPFRKKCRITMENINDQDEMRLYYQIDYTLTDVPDDAAYFHAQFRRTKVNETSDYTIIDNVKGAGHFVGVYLAWQVNNNGWWGEGEIKFFLDGDTKFPTICGTNEDYFCALLISTEVKNTTFTTPFEGLCSSSADRTYRRTAFGLYRCTSGSIRLKRILASQSGLRLAHGGVFTSEFGYIFDLFVVSKWHHA